MKRVILLRPKIGLGLGGAENHTGMVALKFLERGFEVGLIAHSVSFPPKIFKDFKFYPIKFQGFGSLPKQIVFIIQAQRLLSRLSYDYLISFFRYPWESDLFILSDPLFAFLIKQKRVPLVSFRLRYQLFLKLEKKTLDNSKKIIALFSSTKDLIQTYYPQNLAKTVVCYRGIDQQRFCPELKEKKNVLRKEYNLKENDFVILFVGYDTQRKGLELLLKIMPKLPNKVKLLIAGKEGPSNERVRYLGKVKKMERIYALSDLFVLPTLYDPGAQATLEALASGTPVITTPYDGTSEFIKNQINGFIVTRDEEKLREVILKSMEINFDPYQVSKSVEDLTWDNYVDCLITQLEML